MNSIITNDDWNAYVVDLFFGKRENALQNCINRGYRDFNRTLHGFRKSNNEIIKDFKDNKINEIFQEVKNKQFKTQEEFDNWHKQVCLEIINYYNSNGYSEFYVGQAQKWINMTFKYIFAYGEKVLSNYSHIYRFCHVPIDNILLKKIEKNSYSQFKCAWSRIDNYDEYISFQNWFREKYTGIPLDNEFKIWRS